MWIAAGMSWQTYWGGSLRTSAGRLTEAWRKGLTRRREGAKEKEEGGFCVSSLVHVVQLPKTFCGHEGVLECSGLTELGMGIERVDGKKSKAVSSHRSPRKQDPV
jgi:hypothetical protein